jgi:hypothetical protein
LRNNLPRFHIGKRLAAWNVFASGSTQIRIIHRERLTTRLYFILFLCIFAIQIVYTVISKQTVSEFYLIPTQTRYEKLHALYSNTLRCPCTHIAIQFKQFMTLDAIFHQVCSSDFVDVAWLDFLFGIGFWAYHIPSDIRGRGAAYFQLISELCRRSQTTLKDAINSCRNLL